VKSKLKVNIEWASDLNRDLDTIAGAEDKKAAVCVAILCVI
jgi:hypothetical protein